MPYYDFICGADHITEHKFSITDLPDTIQCPECDADAIRSWQGLGIKSSVEHYGTGGGRDMKQKENKAINVPTR